jgi:acetyltransferase-like isoleucine patch superfamily enzyme
MSATDGAGRGGLLERLRRKGGLRNTARVVAQYARVRAFSAAYGAWLRLLGVRLEPGVFFTGRIRVHGDPRRISIGAGSWVHRGVRLWTHDYGAGHGRIVIGRCVTLLTDVTINSFAAVTVGDHTAFGDGCYVQDNDHGTEPGVPVMRQPQVGVPVHIGRDVWFGARCIVLKGVTVGDGTVIGAGSVVVKPLPAGVVAVGVPARAVKRRGGQPLADGRAA